VKPSAARRGLRWALLLGVIAGVAGGVLCATAIGQSTISTAALGFFFDLPIVSFQWALTGGLVGFFAGYLVEERRMPRPLITFRSFLAGLVLLAVAGLSTVYVVSNLAISWEVHRVKAMDHEDDLQRALHSRFFGANPFVLAEVVQDPAANAAILREIAIRSDPELHEKLWSIFDLMGSNRHGLAVMRLVSRNRTSTAKPSRFSHTATTGMSSPMLRRTPSSQN
jgi:hypothetical protein